MSSSWPEQRPAAQQPARSGHLPGRQVAAAVDSSYCQGDRALFRGWSNGIAVILGSLRPTPAWRATPAGRRSPDRATSSWGQWPGLQQPPRWGGGQGGVGLESPRRPTAFESRDRGMPRSQQAGGLPSRRTVHRAAGRGGCPKTVRKTPKAPGFEWTAARIASHQGVRRRWCGSIIDLVQGAARDRRRVAAGFEQQPLCSTGLRSRVARSCGGANGAPAPGFGFFITERPAALIKHHPGALGARAAPGGEHGEAARELPTNTVAGPIALHIGHQLGHARGPPP